MFTENLKIAWRGIKKNKAYSFINIFGLTVGFISFLLIALYIFDELTYDRFHSNTDSIYRVVENKTSESGKESTVVSVAYNITERAKKDFPEISQATRFSMLGRSNMYNDVSETGFYESYWIGDESFFKTFDFKFLQGDRKTALKDPYSVVLTEETATKLYGSENVVGRTLRTDRDSIPYKITGVINIPNNSHLQFNLIFSESTLYGSQNFMDFANNDWTSNTFVSYLTIKNSEAEQTTRKINQLVATNRTGDQQRTSTFFLQPLKDIHFHSAGFEGDMGTPGNLTHMYVFGIVALFVLLIACINYMNLTTAKFSNRSKEIAVRKVSGAQKRNLVVQFLTEALMVTLIALILSLIVVRLLLPAFNAFAGKDLSLDFNTDYRIWAGVVLSAILTAALAGIYPALFQARLKPYLLLKNKVKIGKGNLSIRRVLVVFQFSLSILMIIATIIVYKQLKYVDKKDMGFNKNQLVVVDINSGAVRRSAQTIRNEYEKLPGVKSVSVTSRVPGEWKIMPKVTVRTSATSSTKGETMYYLAADDKFLETFEVTLLNGRNFTAGGAGDSSSVMINEAAAKLLGISEVAEQLITIPEVAFSGNASPLSSPFSARVVGIVKDFNYQSLRETIEPMVIAYQQNPVHNIDYFTARVETSAIPTLLKQMEGVLQKIDQAHLFEYNFLDKRWENFYREDEKRQIIFLGVAFLTILIACLGLFGLATYASEQRVKEIGIRKVLGASAKSIVVMLSRDFAMLVLIAAIISFPIAWWTMNNWLNDFAYRTSVEWWVFVLAAGLALTIAIVTISFNAIRAALTNPVKSLRAE